MIEIRVYGTPAPQGSKRHVGNGVMIESSKKVKPWREAVKWALIEYRLANNSTCVPGPINAEMVFTMPRPKSAKKGVLPSTRPDLDKLVRSTSDALSDAGAWEDDARVVRCLAMKVFVGSVFPGHAEWDGLTSPGAIIRISSAVRNAE